MRKYGRIHFIMVLALSLCSTISPFAQEKHETEGMYTIKRGDTLWDISAKFLKDPFLWPKLWQRNPYITNPHWIYPGYPIRLSAVEEVKKEELQKGEVEKRTTEEVKKIEPLFVEKKPETEAKVRPAEEKPAVFTEVRSAGFFSDLDYRGIGTLIESKEGKSTMAEGDIIYLVFKTTDPILIGNKYTLFRASELIKHPGTDKVIGRRYNITGNIQIIDQYGNFYTARVIEAFDAIFKGDMVRQYFKEKMEVQEGKK